ncbi:DNA cytosine methyltransferase [Thermoanaerobacter thermocopriae]|uniref:DNA cytosine methyltransferase n=1 Tax=Thermoanaerobacter thermocopriae TaxID=29350 RepID=UPI000A70286B|nr:DNA cytosine methyltransferase [Thermoanaerobacter thermocopriae]
MLKEKYSVISLFSGAGGMDLGFHMDGSFKFLVANDILQTPALTYAANFSHEIVSVDKFNAVGLNQHPVYVVGDVSSLDFCRICKDVDVIVGGPPCQDFSIVRGPEKERRGIEVKRGKLYAHFVRALICKQPKVFVFENVPGLLSANGGAAYETILKDFSNLNLRWKEIREIVGNDLHESAESYDILFAGVVDAAELGVPQRRRRLIIIGVREDVLRSYGTLRTSWHRKLIKFLLVKTQS